METIIILIQIIQAIALGLLSKNINRLADQLIINTEHKMEFVNKLSDLATKLMILELEIKELKKEDLK